MIGTKMCWRPLESEDFVGLQTEQTRMSHALGIAFPLEKPAGIVFCVPSYDAIKTSLNAVFEKMTTFNPAEALIVDMRSRRILPLTYSKWYDLIDFKTKLKEGDPDVAVVRGLKEFEELMA